MGGGSVFLNIPYKYKAFINDYNKDLTDIYSALVATNNVFDN